MDMIYRRIREIAANRDTKGSFLWDIIFGWGVLTAILLFFTREYTLRHLLFPLATSMIVFWGESLQEKKDAYWMTLAAFSIPLLSLIGAHHICPNQIRFWEAGTFTAFSMAITVFFTVVISWIPFRGIRTILSFVASSLLFLPVAGVWGHVLAEGAWPNADSVFAVFQSNPAESLSYVRDTMGYSVCLVILFLSFFVYMAARSGSGLKVKPVDAKRVVSFLLLISACLGGIGRTRENIVTIPVYEMEGYAERIDSFRQASEKRKGLDTQLVLSEKGKQGGLFVLVIGESATRDHLSAFGYERETTPWMDSQKGKDEAFFFRNAYACYVTTVKVLSYALTAANQYNGNELADSPSIIEVANAAGYKTVWLSNQVKYSAWDTPTTVIADGADEQVWINTHLGETLITDYPDGVLADRFRELPKEGDTFVVIHLMGSHNSYQDRYPADFGIFSGKTTQIDEYDGSILYTDHVVKEIYEEACGVPNFQAMIYLSDHGDGVDSGCFHSIPNFDWQMVRVPMFIAVSPQYAANNPGICNRLREKEYTVFTNDLLFDMILGMMDIKLEDRYDEKNDFTSAGYDPDIGRFLSLYGQRHVSEDSDHIRYR